MAVYALIQNSRIVNIASVDDSSDVGQEYIAHMRELYDDVRPSPGNIGQYIDANGEAIPEPTLTCDVNSIPPDGTTSATVTYTNLQPDTPASVDFDVNGAVQAVSLDSGEAAIAVASSTPGDIVTVSVGDLSVIIEVTS